MPDQGLIDERIKQELRSLEGPYNEGDWQLVEPFVNTLEPPSSFTLNKKAVLVMLLCFALGIGLYFAIPFIRKIQEKPADTEAADTLVSDTTSADPTFKPDTIMSRPAVVQPAPAPVVVDSAAIIAREDSIKAAERKREPVRESKPVPEVKPKKKKKELPQVPLPTIPPKEDESEELYRKDVPIIAVPQEDADEQPENDQPAVPEINLQRP